MSHVCWVLDADETYLMILPHQSNLSCNRDNSDFFVSETRVSCLTVSLITLDHNSSDVGLTGCYSRCREQIVWYEAVGTNPFQLDSRQVDYAHSSVWYMGKLTLASPIVICHHHAPGSG